MIRIMFDSDQLAMLPRDEMCATYADLVADAAHLAALRAEFTEGLVLIDRGLGDPAGAATVIDVETGAHRPADAPAWYNRAKHQRGLRHLTVYCNRSTLPAVEAAMSGRKFYRWVATLDGTMHVDGYLPMNGPALIQFAGAAQTGIHADCSLILAPTWNPPAAGHLLGKALEHLHRLGELLPAEIRHAVPYQPGVWGEQPAVPADAAATPVVAVTTPDGQDTGVTRTGGQTFDRAGRPVQLAGPPAASLAGDDGHAAGAGEPGGVADR